MPQLLDPLEITLTPNEYEATWAPELVWTLEEKNLLLLPGFKH
jgi:hypothetical protein